MEQMEEAKVKSIVQAVIAALNNRKVEQEIPAPAGIGRFCTGDHRALRSSDQGTPDGGTSSRIPVQNRVRFAAEPLIAFLDEVGLCVPQSRIKRRHQYRRQNHLELRLSEELLYDIDEYAEVQVYVSDGLLYSALEQDLPRFFPVLKEGLRAAANSGKAPLVIKNIRLGFLTPTLGLGKPLVCVVAVGERPLLTRPREMSVFLSYCVPEDSLENSGCGFCSIYKGPVIPLEPANVVARFMEHSGGLAREW